LTEVDARGRIASQWDIDEKKKLADVVIENNSSKEDLERMVVEVVSQKLSRSRFWTWMLRIPPVGLMFALILFIWRIYIQRRKDKHC